ncbi:undecaprenyl-diphosphate phosphatase [Bdellovibrio sp. HCB337]|uniref:undecaprenyl-diphosphate phosphatase n=1 Tax=Bdellovibrio sp. HCB337 TaxID=3394358 RepID=UPI0039A548FE
MTLLQAIILAIVEGLTEFLPISSTGHMVLTSYMMGIEENTFVKSFEVIIQFGAILAVLVVYWKRFLPNWGFYKKLFVAFLPTAIIGFVVKGYVDILLGQAEVVAWSFIIGGVILIWTDKFFAKYNDEGRTIEQLSYKDSILLGLFQSIAMIPGVSRSAATIIGGLSLKMNRKEAAEFSFFLAVPTLAAATLYKGVKLLKDIESSQIHLLIVGNVIAFAVAILAIKSFIRFLSSHGFKYFGYYRILMGLIFLVMIYAGVELKV